MKVSIIIINYNYRNYVGEAIRSVLSQTRPADDIIVVDDGSTDDSLLVINSFSDKIKVLSQSNSGMTEAANLAFSQSFGDVVLFLDADDYLYPNAVQTIVDAWNHDFAKIQWRMHKVDSDGNRFGYIPTLEKSLPSGEVWRIIAEGGDFISPPTSGNAYSRNALSQLLPARDAIIGDSGSYFDRIPLDAYLKRRIPFLGSVYTLDSILSVYRVHGLNSGVTKSPYRFPDKRRRILVLALLDIQFLSQQIRKLGQVFDQRVLFRKNKMQILRILSLRIDHNPPFSQDSRKMLFMQSVYSFRMSKKSLIKRLDVLVIHILLLIAPKRVLITRFSGR